MFGLLVMEVMYLSGHPLIINKISMEFQNQNSCYTKGQKIILEANFLFEEISKKNNIFLLISVLNKALINIKYPLISIKKKQSGGTVD
jgi:hypothetical protein